MPYVKCENCGTNISVMRADFRRGQYPKLCPDCQKEIKPGVPEDFEPVKQKKKRKGYMEKMTDDVDYFGDGDEVVKDL